jgi:hypothetical protein
MIRSLKMTLTVANASHRGLEGGAEGEELNAAVAADINLALGEGLVEPSPDALDERPCHADFPLVSV